MRIFPRFPENAICPVCGTNDQDHTLLVPIHGTKDGFTVEAVPTHMQCILENLEYSPEHGVMGVKAEHKQEADDEEVSL